MVGLHLEEVSRRGKSETESRLLVTRPTEEGGGGAAHLNVGFYFGRTRRFSNSVMMAGNIVNMLEATGSHTFKWLT